MKSKTFIIFIIFTYTVALILGSVILSLGYGLPGEFNSQYSLENLGLLSGVSRVTGKPVFYELPVVTLLKPGPIYVNITIYNVNYICEDSSSPYTIRLYANGGEYESNTTMLLQKINRNSVFTILYIKIIIKGECVPTTPPTPIIIINIWVED